MSSSDQTDCSQQLQHQRLCPDAMKALGLVRVRQTRDQYSIHTHLKKTRFLVFLLKKKEKLKFAKMLNQIEEHVSNRSECQVYPQHPSIN